MSKKMVSITLSSENVDLWRSKKRDIALSHLIDEFLSNYLNSEKSDIAQELEALKTEQNELTAKLGVIQARKLALEREEAENQAVVNSENAELEAKAKSKGMTVEEYKQLLAWGEEQENKRRALYREMYENGTLNGKTLEYARKNGYLEGL